MDEIDKRIVGILCRNGRETLTNLARSVGLSVVGVRKRLNRLIDRDIKIKALVNSENIILALIAMEFEDAGAIEQMIQRFRDCPRIIKFFITVGSYNVFALVFADDYHTLESMSLEKCSLRSQKGLRKFEIYPIQEVHYDPFIDLKIVQNRDSEFAPCGVFCGDCKRYLANKCAGCPATRFYRGKL
jgi:DNA-binding Lrp family transcriptional regulator